MHTGTSRLRTTMTPTAADRATFAKIAIALRGKRWRVRTRVSEDGRSYFDEDGNEHCLFCAFCDRPTRTGIDCCWKCKRRLGHDW
jgi:hypothetical protein